MAFLDRLLLFFFERPCGRFLGFRANPRDCWKKHTFEYIYIYIYKYIYILKYKYCVVYQLCAKFYRIISLHNDGFPLLHTFWVPPSPADPSESDGWSMQAWWSLDPERLVAPPYCCHGDINRYDKIYPPGNYHISHFTKTCNPRPTKKTLKKENTVLLCVFFRQIYESKWICLPLKGANIKCKHHLGVAWTIKILKKTRWFWQLDSPNLNISCRFLDIYTSHLSSQVPKVDNGHNPLCLLWLLRLSSK